MLLQLSYALALSALLQPATSRFQAYIETPNWIETDGYNFHTPKNKIPMPSLVIDTFQNKIHNDLGYWHGAGEDLPVHHEPGFVRLDPTDPDQNFHTQFNIHGCFSLIPWQHQFLHVVFEGTEEFTVSLNEHNIDCEPLRSPFPGVPDSVQASRYVMRTKAGWGAGDDGDEWNSGADGDDNGDGETTAGPAQKQNHRRNPLRKKPMHRAANGSCVEDGDEDGGDGSDDGNDGDENGDEGHRPASPEKTELFIPLSHFNINHTRVVSVSFTGFYTNVSLVLRRVEFVSTVPRPSAENNYFKIPEKAPSGTLVLRCSRPNSFAFGIDDGQPRFAQRVMRILDEEGVRATFFVVGAGLTDLSTNFTNFYREMIDKGHQVALHSNTHPKMEALPTIDQIDEEIVRTIQVFHDELGVQSRYFRPPFGTVGARMRQQLAKRIPHPLIVNWSVDVEDWLWANTSTPEKQLEAFYRNVARGGNLAVLHFLSPTTVEYLPTFIRHVKAVGLSIMRIDQCLEDPDSPPL
ncbi:Glycoside hydrolase/deacetylase beta/alpha-barrel [Penicillium verhagenii]|uniref:Glycoside hydrolase/deacetylase beta/alpha-barrel n=1 Tax=Penicillium verhagenii TaxID=1562060 RepID=UPI0025450D9E|nr:Glycoside hydrolase/deacetylase beta/alpha-barrel [Penicillium verhagenii]KAJ5930525.1 Glycoside hydrolase/deacetylase beta/alpha-barrel [Penicillium verhagenii]